MASQLMPSSRRTNALARRASRCAADPSRASSIKSRRDSLSRKPGRIMQPSRIAREAFGKRFLRVPAESGYSPKQTHGIVILLPSEARAAPRKAKCLLLDRGADIQYALTVDKTFDTDQIWMHIKRAWCGGGDALQEQSDRVGRLRSRYVEMAPLGRDPSWWT